MPGETKTDQKTDQAKRASLIKFLAQELGVSEAAFKTQANKGREVRITQRETVIIQAHIKMQQCCADISVALNDIEKLGVDVTLQRMASLSFVNLCTEQAGQLSRGAL